MLNLTSRAAKMREWMRQLRLLRTMSRPFAKRIGREMERVGKDAARHWLSYRAVLTTDEHETTLRQIFVGFYSAILSAAARRVLNVVRKSASMKAWETKATEDTIKQEMARFIRANTGQKVKDISATTGKRIRAAVKAGQDKGLSDKDIAKLIYEKTGNNIGRFRAEVIARTEAHAASQAGSMFAIEALELPGKVMKEWVAVSDDRTREDHDMMDGDKVELDSDFNVPSNSGEDQMMFPGDPAGSPENVINCRCAMVYSTEVTEAL